MIVRNRLTYVVRQLSKVRKDLRCLKPRRASRVIRTCLQAVGKSLGGRFQMKRSRCTRCGDQALPTPPVVFTFKQTITRRRR